MTSSEVAVNAGRSLDDLRRNLEILGVTEKQFNFVLRLARDRAVSTLGASADERVAALLVRLERERPTRREVSTMIGLFMTFPTTSRNEQVVHPGLTPGVYDVDGRIYVVKPNRVKDRLYAKRLTEKQGADRVNVDDDTINIEFVYDPGAVYVIRPEHRMSLDRALELARRYGRCVNCNRKMEIFRSDRNPGVGPVCSKAFKLNDV